MSESGRNGDSEWEGAISSAMIDDDGAMSASPWQSFKSGLSQDNTVLTPTVDARKLLSYRDIIWYNEIHVGTPSSCGYKCCLVSCH